jgi:hypothetical protein
MMPSANWLMTGSKVYRQIATNIADCNGRLVNVGNRFSGTADAMQHGRCDGFRIPRQLLRSTWFASSCITTKIRAFR